MTEIIFLSFEEKEMMSLRPIWESVRKKYEKTILIQYSGEKYSTKEAIYNLTSSKFPIIICASPRNIINKFRPAWSYIYVGVEHGLSPFKRFTYNDWCKDYDYYFAPTILWLDRLKRLYPNVDTHLMQGDYFKAKTLQSFTKRNLNNSPSKIFPNILVIFSWGLERDSFFSLPDVENVTYLLHPAQTTFNASIPFRKATVIYSKEGVTERVITDSDLILGDLSSLTFELATIKETYLFIDRNFYIDNYDIEEGIMDQNSTNFGRVPETDHRIDPIFILDKSDMISVIESGLSPKGKQPLHLDNSIIPSIDRKIESDTVKGIFNIIEQLDKTIGDSILPDHYISSLLFLEDAYQKILGRQFDIEGLMHHANRIKTSHKSLFITVTNILTDMASSSEATNRSEYLDMWPTIEITYRNSFPLMNYIKESNQPMTASEFLNDAFTAILCRGPSDADTKSHLEFLENSSGSVLQKALMVLLSLADSLESRKHNTLLKSAWPLFTLRPAAY